jgi:hypothetical protein
MMSMARLNERLATLCARCRELSSDADCDAAVAVAEERAVQLQEAVGPEGESLSAVVEALVAMALLCERLSPTSAALPPLAAAIQSLIADIRDLSAAGERPSEEPPRRPQQRNGASADETGES